MPIPEPFTSAALTAGVLTNLAADILKHHAQKLEETLVGRLLKTAGLIEPNFEDRLRNIIAKALELYFEMHPQYKLSGITAFFSDPAVAQQIGGYILDRKAIDERQIEWVLDKYIKNDDPTTKALLKQRNLKPTRIVPDFIECYRIVLNQHLSIPQMAILLEMMEQTDTVVAEIQASEARLKEFITELLQHELPPQPLSTAHHQTGPQELAANLAKATYATSQKQPDLEEQPIPIPPPKKPAPSILIIGCSTSIMAVESIEWGPTEPNVADYDIVIMDLTTAQTIQLPPPQAYSRQPRFQVDMSKYLQWSNIQRSVERLALSGGELYVIMKPEMIVHPDSPRRQVYQLQNSSLFPFVPFGEQISGQSITWVEPRFNLYFQQVKNWKSVFSGHLHENFSQQVICETHPLAKNRADEIIALSISIGRVRSEIFGTIYLLPPPTEMDSTKAIELLLANLGYQRTKSDYSSPAADSASTTKGKPNPTLPMTTEKNKSNLNLRLIRRRLNQMTDDSDLDAFCLDYFPEVYDKFSRGLRKDEKINLLLDYCRRVPNRFEALLALLEELG